MKYKVEIKWNPTLLVVEAESPEDAQMKAEERNDYIIEPKEVNVEGQLYD